MAWGTGEIGRAVRRISVVGATGSGKSFLARRLAQHLRLPHYELDTFRYDAGQEVTPEKFTEMARELASRDKWIIDGHYRLVRHLIWNRADTIVWLDYPLPVVAMRLLRRFAKGQKRRMLTRLSRASTHGISDQASPGITPATWSDRLGRMARTIRERSEYGRLLIADQYPHARVVRLKSKSAREEWLAQLAPVPEKQ